MKRTVILTSNSETNGYPHAKQIFRSLPHTTHKHERMMNRNTCDKILKYRKKEKILMPLD